MSYDSGRTRPPTTFDEAPADLLTELVGMLAVVLHLKPDKIDPDQTFRSLGLDSLRTVEFVATVNAYYGIAVRPDALFDQPTPLAFARHVIRERGNPSATPPLRHGARPADPPARASGPPRRTGAPAARVTGRPQGGAPPEHARPGAPAREAVLEVLREELARILCCDPWDVSTTDPFNLLGVDSILGAEFVATVNGIYGLHERAVTLYDHPNLAAMAAHLASVIPSTAPAPDGTMDLADLLDAVRDDRISVDEALTLLPRRA
ncbi:acyl carrier protein [Streptomyces sp. NPDC006285]|uniref:acyl carrier protein n=1 Tax=Streptomyces sp. NPDC006285 TaxID=3364742 RepID=UPI0036D0249A